MYNYCFIKRWQGKENCDLCNPFMYNTKSGQVECTPPETKINCQRYNEKGCIKCIDNYAYDWLKGVCLKNKATIENCERTTWDRETRCRECKDIYRIAENGLSCIQVEKSDLIENCLKYKSRGGLVICDRCDGGYYLDYNHQCTAPPPINRCLLYSKRSCIKCKKNFRLGYNGFADALIQKNEHIMNLFYENRLGKELLRTDLSCQKEHVFNCLEYQTTDPLSCKLCELNYFLFQNVCHRIL